MPPPPQAGLAMEVAIPQSMPWNSTLTVAIVAVKRASLPPSRALHIYLIVWILRLNKVGAQPTLRFWRAMANATPAL